MECHVDSVLFCKYKKAPINRLWALFVGNFDMEKTKKNKDKDKLRTDKKIWIDKKTKPIDRTTGSGVTFTGEYIDRWKR